MLKTGFELPIALTREDINSHECMVYTPENGYVWVRQARDDQPTWDNNKGNWHAKADTNVEALTKAREAGFNPTAVFYCHL